jgi:antitoxin PrlF
LACLDQQSAKYYFLTGSNTEVFAMSTMTVKGQVTIPKALREAAGLKPGDKVDMRATASGGIYMEKPGKHREYRRRLDALSKRRLIKGRTDDIMRELRGDPDEDPKL